MKLKKLTALGLLGVMVMTMLSGCGNGKNEVASTVTKETAIIETTATDVVAEGESKEIVFPLEETMKTSFLAMYCGTWPFSEENNLAWDYMLEMANIEVDVTNVPLAEIVEKGSLIMAGGDYPEVLFKCNHLPLDDYGKEGILIPLEDLIREYMPNLTAYLDEEGQWGSLKSSDGHIYSLPSVQNKALASGSNNVYWINQRWLDNVGMELPTSKEELYDVLKAFKEQDANGNGDPNDEIPFAFQDGDTDRLNYYLHEDDYRLLKNNFIITKDGELEFYPTTEAYKNDYLAYVKKLYDENLIDRNSFTMNREQLTAISMNADVLGMTMNATLRFAPDEWLYDFVTLPCFNEEGISLNSGIHKGGLAITDKCENPEVILAWFDYLYSEEGSELAVLGIEGVSYERNADGTYSKLGEWDNYNYQCTFVGGGPFPVVWPELANKPSPDGDSKSNYVSNMEMYGDKLFGSGVVLPTLVFTEEEIEVASTLETDISNYISTYRVQVITGEVSMEDTWQEFQNNLVKMGVEKLISIYKDAYARATAE